MSSNRIKWGILGTSFISGVMAKAIQESATSELAAIGSRTVSTAKKFAEQYAIAKYYDDYQVLLDDPEIDAVYIGLPNHLHKEWIIRCARAGKHILCEKPFVISTAEAHEVMAVLQGSKVFCMEALMYRCHPFTKKLQELMQSKIIGDIKFYNAHYSAHIIDVANPAAGGSIRNLGCYPVSLVRLLAGSEPIAMTGLGRMDEFNRNDNQASILLKFADGAIASISTADDMKMSWQFDVYGTQGRLHSVSNPWLPEQENTILIYKNDDPYPVEINVSADKSLYTYQIDTVCNHILHPDSGDRITLQDSLGNITVLESWLKFVMSEPKITNINNIQSNKLKVQNETTM